MNDSLHSTRPTRILLFIGGLGVGGAERQFVDLAKTLHGRGVPVAVMLNHSDGGFFNELMKSGIPIHVLHMKGVISLPGYYFRAHRVIRQFRPDVIYGFMGGGIKSTYMTLFNHKVKIVWGIRNALTEDYFSSADMQVASYLDRWFSPTASALICNSRSGAEAIVSRGFRNSRIRVVNNGTDTDKFLFKQISRARLRNSWGVSESVVMIGLVGRVHPVKNHKLFIDMAKQLLIKGKDIGFVCAGSGDAEYLKELLVYAELQCVAENIIWLGYQEDVVPIYSALDILVSSSDTEAFPNVILEAMSVGLPVVGTDVGDCREIIGDVGWIVPVNNSDALAEAVQDAISELPYWNKQVSRQRVIDNYSIETMLDKTLAVIAEVLQD